MKGLQKRFHVDGSHVWYIDKRVKRYGRLCESTGTDNREEAARYLLHRLHELREVLIYGERPTRCDSKIREHLREKENHKTLFYGSAGDGSLHRTPPSQSNQ